VTSHHSFGNGHDEYVTRVQKMPYTEHVQEDN